MDERKRAGEKKKKPKGMEAVSQSKTKKGGRKSGLKRDSSKAGVL